METIRPIDYQTSSYYNTQYYYGNDGVCPIYKLLRYEALFINVKETKVFF